MKKFILSAFFLFLVSSICSKSENLNGIGLSASLQSSQFGISVPIRVGQMTVIVPSIDLRSAENVATDIIGGLSARFYRNHLHISPYYGFNIGLAHNSPAQNNVYSASSTDFIVGPSLGAEYYLGNAFSIGIEAQANISISDKYSNRFGNPGSTNINLATVIFATIYFK